MPCSWRSLAEIDADRLTILDPPFALDHDAIGRMGAAQHQRGDRIAGAGKAQFIERPEGEVGLLADGDLADIVAAEAAGGAFGRPAQRVEMGDGFGVVFEAAEHQGVADGFHQVGIVVRGRTIDAEADRSAGGFQFLGAAEAGGEDGMFEVGQWQMPTPCRPSFATSSSSK